VCLEPTITNNSFISDLFLSVGGNDGLRMLGLLSKEVSTIGEALTDLYQRRKQFEEEYEKLITELLKKKLPLAVCTIYNPNYDREAIQMVRQFVALL
jgi:hypothetical protein